MKRSYYEIYLNRDFLFYFWVKKKEESESGAL
jgi:hypothetical protein